MNTDNPYQDDKSDMEAAISMDKIAKTVFAPVYPLIAEQIKATHGITSGECVDLGSGPAALSICLARITNLRIHALDVSRLSYAIAKANIDAQGLSGRIIPVTGDVIAMPFEDNFADIIVSRGSIFFWKDMSNAFNEIFRILKPGGKTYIGGGFGSAELKKSIFEQMAKKNDDFEKKAKGRMNPENIRRIKDALALSRASNYKITQDETGFWIHMIKGQCS